MLRLVSALCLALTLFAALPHLHADDADGTPVRLFVSEHASEQASAHASSRPSDRPPIADLTSDDAHESHRASLDSESHPCALCRSREQFEHAAAPPEPLQIAQRENPRRAVARDRVGPAWRVIRRAPARAPPLA